MSGVRLVARVCLVPVLAGLVAGCSVVGLVWWWGGLSSGLSPGRVGLLLAVVLLALVAVTGVAGWGLLAVLADPDCPTRPQAVGVRVLDPERPRPGWWRHAPRPGPDVGVAERVVVAPVDDYWA